MRHIIALGTLAVSPVLFFLALTIGASFKTEYSKEELAAKNLREYQTRGGLTVPTTVRSREPAGNNCANGGTKEEVIYKGQLQYTSYLCN